MPVNKSAYNRYLIIDKCLQRRNQIWTIKDLLKAVADDYRETLVDGSGVSERTLKGDIHNMRLPTHHDAPIKYSRKKGYYYTDPDYSIYKTPLTSEDLLVLHQSLHTLKSFRGLGIAEDLSELVQRLEHHLPSDDSTTRPILQLEAVPDYTGSEFLKPLYQAIREEKPLLMQYQPYRAAQSTEKVIHPYLLKTYNGRWYLLAGNESKGGHLQNYALDRIKKLAPSSRPFRPTMVDFSTYFDSLIGVTIPETNPHVQTIRLHITAGRAPYVLTKPLHTSQRIISNTADGLEVELRLLINQELKTRLLGFGPDLQVLAPQSLRSAVYKLLSKALTRYE
jgi:predicted DNA-binding transcriptional regulator YafY